MPDELTPQNGEAPSGTIVITIALVPTPSGYAMQVNHPNELFPDTVIDACYRAARFYERLALVQQLGQTQPRVIPGSAIDPRLRLS